MGDIDFVLTEQKMEPNDLLSVIREAYAEEERRYAELVSSL